MMKRNVTIHTWIRQLKKERVKDFWCERSLIFDRQISWLIPIQIVFIHCSPTAYSWPNYCEKQSVMLVRISVKIMVTFDTFDTPWKVGIQEAWDGRKAGSTCTNRSDTTFPWGTSWKNITVSNKTSNRTIFPWQLYHHSHVWTFNHTIRCPVKIHRWIGLFYLQEDTWKFWCIVSNIHIPPWMESFWSNRRVELKLLVPRENHHQLVKVEERVPQQDLVVLVDHHQLK